MTRQDLWKMVSNFINKLLGGLSSINKKHFVIIKKQKKFYSLAIPKRYNKIPRFEQRPIVGN